jgi:hypothetical protein
MPAPLIMGAAAVAARLAAKKAATNVVKKAATKKAAAANARGLKAAQKPTNRTGTKADRAQRAEFQGKADLIKNASPARANRTRGGSLASMKAYGGYGVTSLQRSPQGVKNIEALSKELNPKRTTPAKKDIDTFIKKRAVRNEQISAKNKPGFSQGKSKLIRQINASKKSK